VSHAVSASVNCSELLVSVLDAVALDAVALGTVVGVDDAGEAVVGSAWLQALTTAAVRTVITTAVTRWMTTGIADLSSRVS